MRLMTSFGLTLTLALVLSSSPESGAQTAAPLAVVGDTGILTLGPNQSLRLTVIGKTPGEVTVRFRRFTYADGTCAGEVCTHPLASQSTSDLMTLASGEGASTEIPNTAFGVRGQVLSSTPGVRVLAEITDGTSNTLSIIAILIG